MLWSYSRNANYKEHTERCKLHIIAYNHVGEPISKCNRSIRLSDKKIRNPLVGDLCMHCLKHHYHQMKNNG